MTTSVIYARFSPRPNGAEVDTIEAQIAKCRAYCAAQGWEVIGTFDDQELSGASIEGRSGLASALEMCCANKSALVVYSLSRLARNTADAISISQRLNKAEADLVSVAEKLDTTSPMGKCMFAIMAAMAQLEREQTSQRTSDAMRHYQKEGRRMSSRLPYGWKPDPRNDKLMIKCEKEQATIQQMIALRRKMFSLREIARALEDSGFKSRTGGDWCHVTIGDILKREVVNGK